MAHVVNFGPEFEANLKRIHAEVMEQKKEAVSEAANEREIVRRSLESISSAVPVPSAEPERAPVSAVPPPSSLPAYLYDASADPRAVEEVERLVRIVYADKIEKAIAEAKKHPPFVLDALHDALVDKFIPELKKRGML